MYEVCLKKKKTLSAVSEFCIYLQVVEYKSKTLPFLVAHQGENKIDTWSLIHLICLRQGFMWPRLISNKDKFKLHDLLPPPTCSRTAAVHPTCTGIASVHSTCTGIVSVHPTSTGIVSVHFTCMRLRVCTVRPALLDESQGFLETKAPWNKSYAQLTWVKRGVGGDNFNSQRHF